MARSSFLRRAGNAKGFFAIGKVVEVKGVVAGWKVGFGVVLETRVVGIPSDEAIGFFYDGHGSWVNGLSLL